MPPLHFDFNASFNANGSPGSSPTHASPFPYTSVVSTAYSAALHYGWVNALPGNYDRGASTLIAPASGVPDLRPLLQDFNDGGDSTFQVDLLGGTTYTVNVTLGDSDTYHGPVEILADGSLVPSITLGNGTTVSTLSSPRGQFLTGSFQVTAPAGSGLQPVTLEFKAINGAADFVLNALDIVQTQNPITLTASAPDQNGLVTVSGSGATPNSLVTVGASLGTITTTDQEGNYAGTQVVADSNGNFTYTVLETATGLATFSAQEVDGASFGNTTQTVVPPLHFQFGASFNANGGGGPSPSQTTPFAYTDVVSTPYSSALHYGWLNTPGNYDRGAATLQAPTGGAPDFRPLLEAFNDGSGNTFEVDLLGGTTYTVNVTMGDSNTYHGPVQILADGSPVPSITLGDGTTVSTLSSPRGQFLTGSFQVSAPAGSGLQPVTLEFKAVNGAADFVLNALDIVQTQNAITLTKTGESFVNGFEVLTLSGQGAAANSLVTLSSSLGTVTADSTGQTVSDADPNYAGIQVRTDASGSFTFAVQTQTPATSGTVSARDVTGVAAGSSNVTITSPVVSYHFDFVNDSGTGNATSPTAPGYLAVLPNTVYQGTPQPYGWQSSGLVSGFNDGTTDANASPALTPPAFSNNATINTDLAEAGQAGNSATFDVAVAAGHTYTLTFYLGDALQAHEMTIAISGGSVTIDPQSDGGLITTGTPPPGGNGTLGRGAGGWLKFSTSPFTATSSTLAITFTGVQPGGLDGNFVLDGLDVIDPPGPPAATAPTLAPVGQSAVISVAAQPLSPASFVVQTAARADS